MINILNFLLAQGCPPMPDSAAGGGGGLCGEGGFSSLIFLVVIFAIFYFLFIRPSQQKQKEHKEMIDSLQKGDRVITQGGIHGKITNIKANSVKLQIAPKTEIEVEKGMVGRVENKES